MHALHSRVVNLAQAADVVHTVPLRRTVVEELVRDLKARGRLVSVEYL